MPRGSEKRLKRLRNWGGQEQAGGKTPVVRLLPQGPWASAKG